MSQDARQDLPATATAAAAWTIPGIAPPVPERPGQGETTPLERLLHVFQAHIAGEQDTLVVYRDLETSAPDRLVGMLVRLVLEDEERHHGLLERMAARLRDSLYWTRSRDALPRGDGLIEEITPATLEAYRRAIRDEQEGARTLRAIAQRDGDLYDGLFGLLLDVMATDSEKHAKILQFALRRLEAAS